ncbi:MAG: DUF2652 domain-containing protein, partial [Candidatus Limnocylindria bacterium]
LGDLHRAESGTLIIGDLSGYTRYLSETELEHAHAVLDGVFGVLGAALQPAYQLKELEGDAVFVYRLEAQPDPAVLLDGVEQTYFAFRRHMRDAIAATTCECDACRRMPQLDLKFTAHFGSFVVGRVGTSGELTGPDVVIVHRLLKNHVAERLGLSSYAIYTDALVRASGLDPATLAMVPHTEDYEHLGPIELHVQDLSQRWDAEQAAERVVLDPSRVFVDEIAEDLPVPPAELWQHLTDPHLRMGWQGLRQIDEQVRSGRRGVGTRSHCVHESGSFGEEILDWHPFEHEAVRMAMPRMGSVTATFDLEPVPGGTRLRYRCGEPRGALLRLMRPMVARQLRRTSRAALARLRSVLADSTPDHAKATRAAIVPATTDASSPTPSRSDDLRFRRNGTPTK